MDKTRLLELLEKKKALESENTSLYEVDKSEFAELSSYYIVLEEQILYRNRYKYIDLVKKCLNGKINCYALQWDFFEIYNSEFEIFDKLIKK